MRPHESKHALCAGERGGGEGLPGRRVRVQDNFQTSPPPRVALVTVASDRSTGGGGILHALRYMGMAFQSAPPPLHSQQRGTTTWYKMGM